jgi:hypothetical protein
MKVKLNRRLLLIGVVCLFIAVVITLYTFDKMKEASQPEATESIIYFSNDLTRGTILTSADVKEKSTPISMIPDNAIRDKKEIIDRELIVDVNKDEFALLNKTTVRGEVRENIENMWEIGLEVEEISDFLGSQIKIDDYYALLFADPNTNTKFPINKVKVTGLIDGTGKTVYSNSESVPKVVIIAVNSEEEMNNIASYKMKGAFELARPPKDWNFDAAIIE